jgi:hypothetical protein
MSDRAEELLQELIAEVRALRRPPEPLGFTDAPVVRRIEVNLQYPGGCMYFWNGATKTQTMIAESAIRCRITGIEIEHKEHRGKPNNKVLLRVMMDRPYIVVMGLETLTAKSMLIDLLNADLSIPVMLAFSTGKSENALFCNVWQNGDRLGDEGRECKAVTESETIAMVNTIARRLGSSTVTANGATTGKPTARPPEATAPPVELGGQGVLIEGEGQTVVDRMLRAISDIQCLPDAITVAKQIADAEGAIGDQAVYATVVGRFEQRCRPSRDAADRAAPEIVAKAGWTTDQARDEIARSFKKSSRNQLSVFELLLFLANVQSKPRKVAA